MAPTHIAVSYVVTVYNKARYLPGVLDAIAAQNGDFTRQFVFVDDGSTDNSLPILQARTAGWRDAIVITRPNAGAANATNTGVKHATGEFIKFVDGDDILSPDATSRLLGVIRRHDADLAFGAGGHYDIGQSAPVVSAALGADWLQPDPFGMVVTRPPFNLSQILVRRAAVEAVGGCDERIFVPDYPVLLRLARDHRFAGTDAVVCFFPRQQGGGRMTDDHENMLFHANLSVLLFIAEHALPADKLRLAARRACGRAWLYAKRHRARTVLSADYARFAASRMLPAIGRARAQRLVRASLASFPGAIGRYRALLETLDG